MGRVWYCTREEVMDAFDTRESSARSAQVDNAISSASDDIDGWLNRHKHGLAPTTATRYFEWPRTDGGGATKLWFDENELVSVSSFVSGGTSLVENTDYFLEPVNSGPPYTYAEINRNSSGSFSNSGTSQRAIAITGVWGLNNDQVSATTLDGAVNASVTSLDVDDSNAVGVGSVITIDSERMLVTAKTTKTTGTVLTGAMDELDSDRIVEGVSAGFSVGETILVGQERMKILENDGTNLTVQRAYDGSVLQSHLAGATIYAYRRLTVQRGALGTTAASHADNAPITLWDVPPLVRDLARAEAITRLEQEWSAYGARVYSDEAERDSSGTEVVSGRGLTDIRKSCARKYKRKFRKAAI